MTKNEEILEVFNKRYACKKFSTEKRVSDEDLKTILESARLSPSSFGMEPWKFLLLRNEEMRNDFRQFAWGALNSLNGATEIVIILARKDVTGGNMMTVAAYLGIDSCAIEGFNKEQLEKYLSDMGLLDLNVYGVSVMVSFGYRDEDQPKKIRRELKDVLEIIE